MSGKQQRRPWYGTVLSSPSISEVLAPTVRFIPALSRRPSFRWTRTAPAGKRRS